MKQEEQFFKLADYVAHSNNFQCIGATVDIDKVIDQYSLHG